MVVSGVAVYCQDYECSRSTMVSVDKWPDHLRVSNMEQQFVCKAPAASAGRRAAGLQRRRVR